MRIAFFADSYKPYLSGVTNSAEILVNELRALGHRVYVFAPAYPNNRDTDPDIFRFPSLPTGYPKFRLGIPIFGSIPKVDIIHSHSPFQAGIAARLAAAYRRVPFVYTFHTLFTHYLHYARFIPVPVSRTVVVSYLRAFCSGADAIVAPSALAKKVLRAWGIRRPVEIIPSGVDFSRYPVDFAQTRQQLRARYGIGEKDKVLLYVGRLSLEKNISFILNSFRQMEAGDRRLVLVGGGPLEKQLRNEKNVILTGEIPYPEVLSYYLIGDIFVFASLTETQGLVLAEAKAAGLPVVALFAGGLTGTVRPGIDGYLTRRNLPDFSRHVERLLADDALRQEFSWAAREDARDRFSSVVVAKKIESVYNSLIEQEANKS